MVRHCHLNRRSRHRTWYLRMLKKKSLSIVLQDYITKLNLAADTKRLFDHGEKYLPACYLILALIPSFNSSSFNSLIELRAAFISIFTGTSIPPPTRHLPFGSLTWSLLGVKKSFGHAQISLL